MGIIRKANKILKPSLNTDTTKAKISIMVSKLGTKQDNDHP